MLKYLPVEEDSGVYALPLSGREMNIQEMRDAGWIVDEIHESEELIGWGLYDRAVRVDHQDGSSRWFFVRGTP